MRTGKWMTRIGMSLALFFLSLPLSAESVPAPPAAGAPAVCAGSTQDGLFGLQGLGSVSEPEWKQSGCSAQLICQLTVISCNSPNPGTCSVGSNYVECNGNRTYCPNCSAQLTCCDGQRIFCFGYDSCSETSSSVICDGQPGGFCLDCP